MEAESSKITTKTKNISNGFQRQKSQYKNTAFCSGEIKYLLINFPNEMNQAQNYGSYLRAKNILM